ncbi:hypothetical protein DdX_15790 [Ditylenchus destructor]|uniref:Uncharacterized protein n=1 Tax=Ditylenchus destructor TaxID=166010 RepID=A0AAD4MS40_9BILA|nr:hypothetical protein DdX_15790 [Ditylenchus destructor]
MGKLILKPLKLGKRPRFSTQLALKKWYGRRSGVKSREPRPKPPGSAETGHALPKLSRAYALHFETNSRQVFKSEKEKRRQTQADRMWTRHRQDRKLNGNGVPLHTTQRRRRLKYQSRVDEPQPGVSHTQI